jgi:xanthosine utilization system XapX-like protein
LTAALAPWSDARLDEKGDTVDPESLRMMTDPEALKDPERVKAWRKSQHADVRRRVIGSLRINSIVMLALGAMGIAGGLVVAALSVTSPAGPPILVGVLPFGLGGLFFWLGRRYAPASSSLARNGAPATATVVEVRALDRNVGVSRPGLTATAGRVTVVLRVQPKAGAPFEIEHREFILGSDLMHLKVGSAIPVRCDPGARRVAFDWDAM